MWCLFIFDIIVIEIFLCNIDYQILSQPVNNYCQFKWTLWVVLLLLLLNILHKVFQIPYSALN